METGDLFVFDKSWERFQIKKHVEILSKNIANFLIKMYGAKHIQKVQRKIIFRENNFPQVSEDRTEIYLSAIDCYQFIYQFSHELCHCITSSYNVSNSIGGFDEFLCCFTSYFVLNNFSKRRGDKTLRSIFGDKYNISLNNYTRDGNFIDKKEKDRHILYHENPQALFKENRQNYINDKNLIKLHDIYYLQFFEKLLGDYKGLTFIGKIYEYPQKKTASAEELLQWLLSNANFYEIFAIKIVINIFGINFNVNNQQEIL